MQGFCAFRCENLLQAACTPESPAQSSIVLVPFPAGTCIAPSSITQVTPDTSSSRTQAQKEVDTWTQEFWAQSNQNCICHSEDVAVSGTDINTISRALLDECRAADNIWMILPRSQQIAIRDLHTSLNLQERVSDKSISTLASLAESVIWKAMHELRKRASSATFIFVAVDRMIDFDERVGTAIAEIQEQAQVIQNAAQSQQHTPSGRSTDAVPRRLRSRTHPEPRRGDHVEYISYSDRPKTAPDDTDRSFVPRYVPGGCT